MRHKEKSSERPSDGNRSCLACSCIVRLLLFSLRSGDRCAGHALGWRNNRLVQVRAASSRAAAQPRPRLVRFGGVHLAFEAPHSQSEPLGLLLFDLPRIIAPPQTATQRRPVTSRRGDGSHARTRARARTGDTHAHGAGTRAAAMSAPSSSNSCVFSASPFRAAWCNTCFHPKSIHQLFPPPSAPAASSTAALLGLPQASGRVRSISALSSSTAAPALSAPAHSPLGGAAVPSECRDRSAAGYKSPPPIPLQSMATSEKQPIAATCPPVPAVTSPAGLGANRRARFTPPVRSSNSHSSSPPPPTPQAATSAPVIEQL
jgi:hypothetical protein